MMFQTVVEHNIGTAVNKLLLIFCIEDSKVFCIFYYLQAKQLWSCKQFKLNKLIILNEKLRVPKKTLYLHVGTHKTATTALQIFLSENSKKLKKRGLLYPLTGRAVMGAHHHLISSIRGHHPSFPPEKSYQEYLSELHKEINGAENVLISSEMMRKLGPKITALKELENLVQCVKVIIYLRPQYAYAESAYNEVIKNNRTASFDKLQGRLQLDYFHECEQWSELFGTNNIIVRPFEKSQLFNQDIFSDFLHILNLSMETDYIIPKNTINSSLKRDVLEFKRMVNFLSLSESHAILLKHILIAYSDRRPPKASDACRLLSQEQKQKMMQEYETSNARVAEKYLGRKDGTLFIENHLQSQNADKPYPGLSHEEVKEAAMYIHQKNKKVSHVLCKAIIDGLMSDHHDTQQAALTLTPCLELFLEYEKDKFSFSWYFGKLIRRIGRWIR